MDASISKIKTFSFVIIIIYLIALASALIINVEPLKEKQIAATGDIVVEFYYSEGCGHCEERYDNITLIEEYYFNNDNVSVVWLEISDPDIKRVFINYGFKTPPGVVIKNQTNGNYTILLYEDISNENLKLAIEYHLAGNYVEDLPDFDKNTIIDTPFGSINLAELSLPVLTIVLGALDSVNPCSFFVLLCLLSLLLYTKSRKRMLLIVGIFIFFSGFFYFLLMTAILNFFLVINQQLIIIGLAGAVALVFGALNIKDFFFFKQGPSASISEEKKTSLFKQMGKLVRMKSILPMIGATVVLAVSANTVELLCSFNLPLIYTGILTSYGLSSMDYYLYLFVYNLVYIIPLLIIVLVVVITLGKKKLNENQGRVLKLFSGIMFFSIGEILLLKKDLLKNVFVAVGILLICLVITIIVYYIEKRTK